MIDLEEVLEWSESEASHEKNSARRYKLEALEAQIRGLADPSCFPVGSVQRQLAQRSFDRVMIRAEALGFETPGQAIKKEIGTRLVSHALGLPV